MSRTIHCTKLNKEAEGLDKAPYPRELGQRIYDNISKEAWKEWLGQQTILINEYRLSPIDKEVRPYLEKQMENFLFGDGSTSAPATKINISL